MRSQYQDSSYSDSDSSDSSYDDTKTKNVKNNTQDTKKRASQQPIQAETHKRQKVSETEEVKIPVEIKDGPKKTESIILKMGQDPETLEAIRLLTNDYSKTWKRIRKDPKLLELPFSNYERIHIKRFIKSARQKIRRHSKIRPKSQKSNALPIEIKETQ